VGCTPLPKTSWLTSTGGVSTRKGAYFYILIAMLRRELDMLLGVAEKARAVDICA